MTVLGILMTCLLGVSIMYVISKKLDWLEAIGFSFLLGMGAQAFLMFVLDILNITFHLYIILILSLLMSLILITGSLIRRNISLKEGIKKLIHGSKIGSTNLLWWCGLMLVVYVVYAISAKSLFWPTFSSDALGSFDVFAKGLAHEGKMINSLILEKRVGFGAAYPPLYSLSLAYSYMLGFESSKIIPVLFFISFTIGFYTLVKRLTNPTSAILFTLLAICSPELLAQSAINITSVPHAVYAALSVVSIILWHQSKASKYFYLSALLMSFSCFTRSEGVVYLFPLLLFLLPTLGWNRKSYKTLLLYLGLSMIPFAMWQVFLRANLDIMNPYLQVELITYPNLDLAQISKIWKLSLQNITNTNYFGITFYLFIGMVLLNVYNIAKKRDQLWLLFITLLSFFGYLILINQLKLRADTLDNIINYSGKRFFFGITFLMWCYIASNDLMKRLFNRLEMLLNYKRG